MPWLAGGRTEPLPAGTSQLTVGASALVPASFEDVLPVPQVRFRKSVGAKTDVAVEYALPATLSVSTTRWWRMSDGYIGALAGGGLHALPGVFGAETVPLFPFAQVGVMASRASHRREFVAVRAFAPFQARGDFAATVWLVANAGAEWSWSRFRVIPEVGAIVQTTNARDVLIVGGISLRRGARTSPDK